MDIDANLLLRAFCLAVIMESILPFISPATVKRAAEEFAMIDEKHLRILGAVMMVGGLLALTWLST